MHVSLMVSVYLCVTAATAQGLLQIDGLAVIAQLILEFHAAKKKLTRTRIFLHANHAANTRASHINIGICSPDSDVLVTGCSCTHQIPAQIIWQTESRNQRRCISMTNIACSLEEDVCKELTGLHAFTGCDSKQHQ